MDTDSVCCWLTKHCDISDWSTELDIIVIIISEWYKYTSGDQQTARRSSW